MQTLKDAFDRACEALEKEHAALLEVEDYNLRVMNHRWAVLVS